MMSRVSSSLQLDAAAVFNARDMPDLIGVADRLARKTQADFDTIIRALRSYAISSIRLDAVEAFNAKGMPELVGVAKKLARETRADFETIMRAFDSYRRAYQIDGHGSNREDGGSNHSPKPKNDNGKEMPASMSLARTIGIIRALQASDWIEMAEELRLLPDEEFEQVHDAIRVFRKADEDVFKALGPMEPVRLPKSRMRLRRAN